MPAEVSYSDSSASSTTNFMLILHSAVNEIAEGAVQSYLINSNGTLSGPIDTVGSGGDGPAFCVQLSNGEVAAMNYGSGNGSFTPTSTDRTTFDLSASIVNFTPPPNNLSHPHMALEYNEEVFVPDLVSVVLYLSLAIRVSSGFLTCLYYSFDRAGT
jgi:6-phosphogluconolactonase (cycloisomerase 2 family)